MKRAAGESAAAQVEDGMVVGLGTGSTVAWTIRRLGERVREEGLEILGVATSLQAEALAVSEGIKLTSLSQHPEIDLAIDGADQVDRRLFAIKGGGAAHAREKVVSCSARRFLVVADGTKFVEILSRPVPVEVLPFACSLVERRLRQLGGAPAVRMGRMKDGPVITDNGNLVMDVDFGTIEDPPALSAGLDRIPGLVEHGLFDNLDELHLARDGSVEVIRREGAAQ
ncbi:MAG: ribose-5-phosphate isomerase RpiA [Methanothrix sp.]|nr:ribose-5-phosphate isomerase RpiA [Methanothrix sp.]